MLPQLKDAKLVGADTFKNEVPSIAAQITRIKSLPQEPDAIMLCSMMPGVVSAIKQIRAAGIKSMIINGSGVDGSYWLNAVPDLSNFYVPVQGSIYGDDPNPKVTEFNKTYKAATGGDPSSQYVYPGYVMIDVWAKAVERAKSTDADKVVAELEKMKDEADLFGPRTFTPELITRICARYLIVDTEAGKPKVVDQLDHLPADPGRLSGVQIGGKRAVAGCLPAAAPWVNHDRDACRNRPASRSPDLRLVCDDCARMQRRGQGQQRDGYDQLRHGRGLRTLRWATTKG